MLKNIFTTLFLLLFKPEEGWKRANRNKSNHEEFTNNFLFPILGFISITTFVGAMWMSGIGGLHYTLRSIMVVVMALLGGVFLTSFLINEMFPKYGMIKDMKIAQQFAGYSSVVLYLVYFMMPLISGYRGLWALPLLSFFLIYSGSDIFLSIDKGKRMIFSIITLLLIIITPLFLNYLLALVVI